MSRLTYQSQLSLHSRKLPFVGLLVMSVRSHELGYAKIAIVIPERLEILQNLLYWKTDKSQLNLTVKLCC
jgi:hypothetical protein